MRGPKSERCDGCAHSQSGALDSSSAVVAIPWETYAGKRKGLGKKGRSGLIKSFGPRLHWSETCYRNPVSWFPNNEISEKGFGVVLWEYFWTYLWFQWLPAPVFLCFKSDYIHNMETPNSAGKENITKRRRVSANKLLDIRSMEERVFVITLHPHAGLPCGYPTHAASSHWPHLILGKSTCFSTSPFSNYVFKTNITSEDFFSTLFSTVKWLFQQVLLKFIWKEDLRKWMGYVKKKKTFHTQ